MFWPFKLLKYVEIYAKCTYFQPRKDDENEAKNIKLNVEEADFLHERKLANAA